MNPQLLEDLHFPHDKARPIQEDMVQDVHDALQERKDIIMHAPTGIGKTASALAPALTHAIKNKLTVFFLTSRHTQHHIVVDTLQKIKKKHGVNIIVSDIIGKKGMCAQEGVDAFFANEFHEFCKKLREDEQCDYYLNTRKKTSNLTIQAKKIMDELKVLTPCHVEDVNKTGKKTRLCPYEMATELAKSAHVIVADYYYLFNDAIRTSFLNKIDKSLGESIIIVDEAHNVPERVRSLATQRLSSYLLERSITEARKYGSEEALHSLEIIQGTLHHLTKFQGEERQLPKNLFTDELSKFKDYEKIITELNSLGEVVQEDQKKSFSSGVAHFLEAWQGVDEGFVRILSKTDGGFILSYRCLDPSLLTRIVIQEAYSTILMSGTLKPTTMYKDLLGFEDAIEKEYLSPFPKKNKLNLVVPKTTTKFSKRSEMQFKDIGVMVSGIIDQVEGNVAVFFPSYALRDAVYRHLFTLCDRKMILEKPRLAKEEKKNLIEEFKKLKNGVLLGVATGSFGEGLDMPGVLKGVIVVGLPLSKPNLETQSIIAYYDRKFGKGWDYGYVFPAITKCLQNAGRCIRSEHDRGIIVFLDERFAWESYLKCFPKDWDIKIAANFTEPIASFFQQ